MSAAADRIRLIATDLDGTLIGSDQRISQRTLDALAQARANGITVVVATGRGPTALPDFGPRTVADAAICSNGAVVLDLTSKVVVERTDLDGSVAESLVETLRRMLPGSCFAWEMADGYGWEEPFARHGQVLIDSLAGTPLVDFDPAAAVAKLFVAHDDLGYVALADRVKSSVPINVEVTSAGLPFVVITAAGVTKGNALQRLCRRRGIGAAEVVAFGDSWNDLDMLVWAGTGVAMANANDEVKAVADHVAGSHDDDGVATCLAALLEGG